MALGIAHHAHATRKTSVLSVKPRSRSARAATHCGLASAVAAAVLSPSLRGVRPAAADGVARDPGEGGRVAVVERREEREDRRSGGGERAPRNLLPCMPSYGRRLRSIE